MLNFSYFKTLPVPVNLSLASRLRSCYFAMQNVAEAKMCCQNEQTGCETLKQQELRWRSTSVDFRSLKFNEFGTSQQNLLKRRNTAGDLWLKTIFKKHVYFKPVKGLRYLYRYMLVYATSYGTIHFKRCDGKVPWERGNMRSEFPQVRVIPLMSAFSFRTGF